MWALLAVGLLRCLLEMLFFTSQESRHKSENGRGVNVRCDTFTSQITCVSVKCPSSSCRVHVISLTMRQNAKSGSGRTTDHRYFMSSLPVRGLLVILPLLKMQRMVKRQGKFRKLGDRALRCAFTAPVMWGEHTSTTRTTQGMPI